MDCPECKQKFKKGDLVVGWDRYDDVPHEFTYDEVDAAISIEFADNLRHRKCTVVIPRH